MTAGDPQGPPETPGDLQGPLGPDSNASHSEDELKRDWETCENVGDFQRP